MFKTLETYKGVCEKGDICNNRGVLPIGSARERCLRRPSIPAAIIAASAKYGFAHPSNALISKLLTMPSGTPDGHAVLIGASWFSLPQQRYAPLHVFGCIRS